MMEVKHWLLIGTLLGLAGSVALILKFIEVW